MGIPTVSTHTSASDAIESANTINTIIPDLQRIAIDVANFRIRFSNASEVREFGTFILLHSNMKSHVESDMYFQCTVNSATNSPWLIINPDQFNKVLEFERIVCKGTILSKAPKYHVI